MVFAIDATDSIAIDSEGFFSSGDSQNGSMGENRFEGSTEQIGNQMIACRNENLLDLTLGHGLGTGSFLVTDAQHFFFLFLRIGSQYGDGKECPFAICARDWIQTGLVVFGNHGWMGQEIALHQMDRFLLQAFQFKGRKPVSRTIVFKLCHSDSRIKMDPFVVRALFFLRRRW